MSLPAVQDVLPHRAPFLYLDTVDSIDGDTIVGRFCWPAEADFFAGHFPDNPIVPGVLLLEGMAQTFAYLALMRSESKTVFLTGVDKARFRRAVHPGDTVEYRVTLGRPRHGIMRADAEAWVGDDKAASAVVIGTHHDSL